MITGRFENGSSSLVVARYTIETNYGLFWKIPLIHKSWSIVLDHLSAESAAGAKEQRGEYGRAAGMGNGLSWLPEDQHGLLSASLQS